jgi:hypothetical protein
MKSQYILGSDGLIIYTQLKNIKIFNTKAYFILHDVLQSSVRNKLQNYWPIVSSLWTGIA